MKASPSLPGFNKFTSSFARHITLRVNHATPDAQLIIFKRKGITRIPLQRIKQIIRTIGPLMFASVSSIAQHLNERLPAVAGRESPSELQFA
jgi:hypothetical protein